MAHDALPKGTGDMVGMVGSWVVLWVVLLAPGDTTVSQPVCPAAWTQPYEVQSAQGKERGSGWKHSAAFLLCLKFSLSPGSSYSEG